MRSHRNGPHAAGTSLADRSLARFAQPHKRRAVNKGEPQDRACDPAINGSNSLIRPSADILWLVRMVMEPES